jgi:starvation-inducible DNA-binding protein
MSIPDIHPTASTNLHLVLVDLIDLRSQATRTRAKLRTSGCRSLQIGLDTIVQATSAGADALAERLHDPVTPFSIETRSDAAPGPRGDRQAIGRAVPAITRRLRALTSRIRAVHDELDAGDAATSDLLYSIQIDLEQLTRLMGAIPDGPQRQPRHLA